MSDFWFHILIIKILTFLSHFWCAWKFYWFMCRILITKCIHTKSETCELEECLVYNNWIYCNSFHVPDLAWMHSVINILHMNWQNFQAHQKWERKVNIFITRIWDQKSDISNPLFNGGKFSIAYYQIGQTISKIFMWAFIT